MNQFIVSSVKEYIIYNTRKSKKMYDISLGYVKLSENERFMEDAVDSSMIDCISVTSYCPIYKHFFEMNERNNTTFRLNHKYSVNRILRECEESDDEEYDEEYDEECDDVEEKEVKEDESIYDIEVPQNHYIIQRSDGKEVTSFFKFAPIIDPIHLMIGKYKDISGIEPCNLLPSFTKTDISSNWYRKIQNEYNVSYVDAFFTYLTSKLLHDSSFIHGIDYYGSFSGVKRKLVMNVNDDMEYLCDSEYFVKENGNGLFDVDLDGLEDVLYSGQSCKNKPAISLKSLSGELECDDIDDLSLIDSIFNKTSTTRNKDENVEKHVDTELEEVHNVDVSNCDTLDVIEKSNENDEDYDDDNDSLSSCSVCTEDVENRYNDSEVGEDECNIESIKDVENGDEDDDGEDDDEDDEDEDEYSIESSGEEYVPGVLLNFPIHTVMMESLDDTFDRYIHESIVSEDEIFSALFQVIMILMKYKREFQFTHNDLHTNNIMYCKTNIPYLYYEVDDRKYKVPTYGKIYKIIDFGRAIYTLNNIRLCSDSFSKGEDAHTQYNCEPFFDESKQRIEPNYSFDLCRLACSMYDIVHSPEYSKHLKLQKLISVWCQDDRGKSVLYTSTMKERYEGFKLYKMIARQVHNHTPENQLKDGTVFDKLFLWDGKQKRRGGKKKKSVLNIMKI